MKATAVPWSEVGPDIAAKWIEMLRKNVLLASPYFHPKFAGIVARASNNVELAIIEEENEVTALFPFQRMSGNTGVPVGHFLSDYHGLICEPSFACDPPALMHQCRLVAWDFDHLIPSQRCFSPFHVSLTQSPQIDLSQGFDAYSKMRGDVRSNRMKMRRLERDHGPLRFVLHSADQTAMRQLLAWKSQQYRRTKVRDIFLVPWTTNVVQGVYGTQDQDFAGMLSLLYAGEKLVAAQFGMRTRSTYHYWFPAYHPQMAYYSPGSILLLMMAERAPSVGIETIDLGKGISEQKRRFMNASIPLATGFVELSSWRYARRCLRKGIRSLAVRLHVMEPARTLLRALRA
jgi:CelD/BcsL family acetyltransferase involved in cellulose biosynthesis